MQRAKIAWKEHFKAKQVKPPATTAAVGGVIQSRDRRHVMLYLLVLTVRMAQYENVILVIIAKVKRQTKPNVYQDHMQQQLDRFYVFNVQLVHMPRRMEQLIVIRVVMMNINPIRVLQIVYSFEKDFIVQEQQRKWNVQRVKEETVVMKLVNNATKEDFKTWRETPHV